MNGTMSHVDQGGGGLPYVAFPHNSRDGWYVLDHRTSKVAVVNDRPQTGLSAGMADVIAGMLNAATRIPMHERH